MRRTLGKYLPKQNYSISTTAGRQKEVINPKIAWQYGTTEKLLKPVWCNVPMRDIFELTAEAFYLQQKQRQERKNQVITEMLVLKRKN